MHDVLDPAEILSAELVERQALAGVVGALATRALGARAGIAVRVAGRRS